MFNKLVLAALLTVQLGCTSSDTSTSGSAPLSAEIRRTEYGIPHITANDWASLGYGFGYAYAQDNFCVTMREIVFAVGRSAELMGEEMGSVDSDFLFTYLNGDEDAFREQFVRRLPQYAQDLAAGYTRGMNRYLEETGVENLPEGDRGCRNAEWVLPSTKSTTPVLAKDRPARQLRPGDFSDGYHRDRGAVGGSKSRYQPRSDGSGAWAIRGVAAQLRHDDGGSNALALGSGATQNGRGLLLGNPHQPWFGAGAWYEAHLTLPGIYDVAGAALHGYPFIAIGFNRDVAWTHTVSFANRFSLYELTLNPENPLQYDYDGAWRDITTSEVEIKVKLEDGTLETRTKTIYESQYGPVINLKGMTSCSMAGRFASQAPLSSPCGTPTC